MVGQGRDHRASFGFAVSLALYVVMALLVVGFVVRGFDALTLLSVLAALGLVSISLLAAVGGLRLVRRPGEDAPYERDAPQDHGPDGRTPEREGPPPPRP